MQKSTVFSTVITISSGRECRYCHRWFRYVTLGDAHAMRVDALENGGLGPRLLEHSCNQTIESTKSDRSTLGHSKMIVGRAGQKCRRCQAKTRTIYLMTLDAYWVVDDFGPQTTGNLVAHDCPMADDPDE
jgi:hypothetical protein